MRGFWSASWTASSRRCKRRSDRPRAPRFQAGRGCTADAHMMQTQDHLPPFGRGTGAHGSGRRAGCGTVTPAPPAGPRWPRRACGQLSELSVPVTLSSAASSASGRGIWRCHVGRLRDLAEAGSARKAARSNFGLGVEIPMGRPFGVRPDDDGGPERAGHRGSGLRPRE